MAEPDPILVRVELAFRSSDDQNVEALSDRVREAVSLIVGRKELEEFRVRVLPLSQKKGPRPVD
jgi:hypothetical protein